MLIGGLLNFITGDTFSFVVFMAYGAFWLTFAYTLEPAYLAYGAYATDTNNLSTGLTSQGFNASFGRSQFISDIERERERKREREIQIY